MQLLSQMQVYNEDFIKNRRQLFHTCSMRRISIDHFQDRFQRGAPMSLIRLENASESDLDLLARLNKQLIEDEQHDNPMNVDELKERMRQFLNTHYKAYLFKAGDDVKGYALVDHSRDPLYLRHFFICRDSRRQGLGTAAFHLLLQELKTDTIDVEVMWWNERGHSRSDSRKAVSI